MLKVGITGNIGSGKTTVCNIFSFLGVPIYSADKEAKRLMETDSQLKAGIKAHFGDAVYKAGKLQHKVLAQKVFASDKSVALINGLVHPAVKKNVEQWQKDRAQEGAVYTLKEAALLFESGSYKALDQIIVVTAPKELRLKRVMARDGSTEAEVLNRMNKQIPETQKAELANFTLVNNGKMLLLPQILKLHHALLNLCQTS